MSKETKSTAKTSAVRVQPLGDRVLLQRSEIGEEIKGGIIIPDSAKEKPQEAKVVALGTGKTDKDGKSVPFDVKVGDSVLIGKYSGTEVKVDDQDYILLREEEILAVVS
jgi:chaperonin GroES